MNILWIVLTLVSVVAIYLLFFKKKAAKEVKAVESVVAKELNKVNEVKEVSEVKVEKKISFSERLLLGLAKSRQDVFGKISQVFSGNKLGDEEIETLEEILYGADIGTKAVQELIDVAKEKSKAGEFTAQDFKAHLFEYLKSKLITTQEKLEPTLFQYNPNQKGKTQVIMIVGVNGAGKTTTIGKLATKLRSQGATVVVGACDTFRAAAVDQLQVWCDRAGVKMIRAKEGASPSGVGYDALQAAINEQADYCILDTAGRLHTKENLMDELTKSKNVLKKLDQDAPHQTLLVIDAITGQNAIRQAEEFNKALGLTGLIFTKCDGSSKAGSAISIVDQLKLPIAYIGVGESVDDLDRFNVDDYLKALLGV